LLPLEHQLLPAVLALLISQRLRWVGTAPQLDDQPLLVPLILGAHGLQAAE
jgi:phosphoribosylglycinamide formyltransferase-1